MSEVTVAQFAEALKVTVDKLLAQLEEAGIKVKGPQDIISEDAKLELLTHLRKAHGKEENGTSPRRITLKRRAQSEIKVAAPMGKARMVSVEVRRKRTYIKRDVLEEQARVAQEELDRNRDVEEAARRATEAAQRVEVDLRDQQRREKEDAERAVAEEASRRSAEEQAKRAAEQQARDTAERERRAKEEKDRKATRDKGADQVRAPGIAHRRRAVSTPQEGPRATRFPPSCGFRAGRPQARL